MKVNVEVDCTPEEMRRLMGLPDMAPIHDKYTTMVTEMMDAGSVKPELMETMMKSWAPMGDAGMTFWRRLLESGTKTG